MAADEPEEEPDILVDEGELDDETMPFSLDEEADTVEDEDDEDGTIDLEAALAIEPEALETDLDVDEDDEEDEGEDDEEPVREGEFVCNGCHMVFRVTAMANQKARLCRDCA